MSLNPPNAGPDSSLALESIRRRYADHYTGLEGKFSPERAAELAVGGDFFPVGALEYFLLKAHGLSPDKLLVDVGCGTGRLAYQLAHRGHERYAGFDITASMVEYARKLCGKSDWVFGVTEGLRIDVPTGSADYVCFFSVFTHISHEHTYLYLEETKRMLRPGGLVVFSFLEFAIWSHWTQFEAAVKSFGTGSPPNVFLDRHAITRFAHYLDYEIVAVLDGDVPTFPIEEEIVCGDGRKMNGQGLLGQSIAVLRKR